jgi:simple sugar transport system ATP-binding protein
MTETFLELKDIYKSFGGVQALRGVDLTIRSGEIHCLAGENGSGKSTLIKVISGAHNPSKGEIFIEGKRIPHLDPIDAIEHGIQVIYQDFAVFPNLTVAENIAVNHAVMTGAKFMDWKTAHALALEAMEQIGAKMDPDVLVENLSVANRQMVAICRTIINDARLLILDEPTAALTSQEVKKLNTILRHLKDKGIAVVIVNHKLDEIFEIAERLTILRNGEKISSGMIGEYDRQRFVKELTGREIAKTAYVPEPSEEEIFRVEKLNRKGAFENVSFRLKKGDILGITGLLDSGRGKIGDALFGIAPAENGQIYLHGKRIKIKSTEDAVRHNIAYVPEDRLTQGLFLDRSIQDNTIAASIRKYFIKGRLDDHEMYQATVDWIKKIGVVAPSPDPAIRTLSGGNAQKIVIAKWLNTDPALLILNGPTIGVDIGAKSDIHRILRKLAEQGIGIIVISDDLSELIQNCNSIIIMKNGRIAGAVNASEINETQLAGMLSDR